MKAIILAAGIGKRLHPLTSTIPKSLIKIKGKEIIAYQLDYLKKYGINDFVIATGSFHEKIKEYVKNKYPNSKISFVYNPLYEKTNYIYTLWLTKDYANDDIILLHGDLIFDENVIEEVMQTKKNIVLVSKKQKPKEKDFKALIIDDRVMKIGVNIYGKNVFSCMPLYRLRKDDFRLWLKKINDFIKKGKTNCYAEDALNEIINEIRLYPLYFGNRLCMEIDTLEDLKRATKYLDM